ncbi:MAG: 50S ribosomal protein L15 [Candidatus Marinimicrobia bacterium]|nr:50S ribosomal protein L15 [Candidatus Neomarinimicrobiota bacterium]RKY61818.1 MAG: 50S ribosomal protein L15 [Candidatus Neomarinimicrobiota bacterium]
MDLGSLKKASGSTKDRKRVGRGNASGHGKTAGRGHKGYHSRSGSKHRAWVEGGTMPIYRRLPKRGFKNIFREDVQIVNLSTIARLQIPEVNRDLLYEKGIIDNLSKPVKILGAGELKEAVTVTANAFSKTAIEKIEASGGKAIIL